MFPGQKFWVDGFARAGESTEGESVLSVMCGGSGAHTERQVYGDGMRDDDHNDAKSVIFMIAPDIWYDWSHQIMDQHPSIARWY